MIRPETETHELAGPLRVERCACGGSIGAARDNPASIWAAVRWHNATARHLLWRRRMEIERGWIGGIDS